MFMSLSNVRENWELRIFNNNSVSSAQPPYTRNTAFFKCYAAI